MDQIATCNHVILTNAFGIAFIKKNCGFNTGHKEIGKAVSLFVSHLLSCLIFDTECQEAGFINQLDQEIQESMFHVSCCFVAQRGSSSIRLGFTRVEYRIKFATTRTCQRDFFREGGD